MEDGRGWLRTAGRRGTPGQEGKRRKKAADDRRRRGRARDDGRRWRTAGDGGGRSGTAGDDKMSSVFVLRSYLSGKFRKRRDGTTMPSVLVLAQDGRTAPLQTLSIQRLLSCFPTYATNNASGQQPLFFLFQSPSVFPLLLHPYQSG